MQPNKHYISWGKPPEQVASKPVQKTGSRSTTGATTGIKAGHLVNKS